MHKVREIKLPGVGVRHEFATDTGQQIAVLVHHDGRREVLAYDQADPDACTSVMTLSHDDARTVAELLGATQVSEEVVEAQHEVEGPSIAWIKVLPSSAVSGSSIADGDFRSRTGASVVAVIRDGEPVPSPEPEFLLDDGDLIVAVGAPSAVEELRALLEAGA